MWWVLPLHLLALRFGFSDKESTALLCQARATFSGALYLVGEGPLPKGSAPDHLMSEEGAPMLSTFKTRVLF